MQTLTEKFPKLNDALKLLIKDFKTNGYGKINQPDLKKFQETMNVLKKEYSTK
jgi:hypothetical protein